MSTLSDGAITIDNMTDSIYFAPLLPWQETLWTQLTQRVLSPQQSLAHALLAAGMAGMGKRAFTWRLVAWLLCREREDHLQGACGDCESCQWLKSGTHPSLQVLPAVCLPISVDSADKYENNSENTSTKAQKLKSDKKSIKAATSTLLTIKVDDIRALQPFIYQGGQGMRICVLDHAEQMTVAAANALLKTLEEPQAQVHLLLISDKPAQLLPTIKSRVQQLPLQVIATPIAHAYVTQVLGSTIQREAVTAVDISQLLQLANGAPLAAIAIAQAPWYSKRALWLTTWHALRSGKRSSIAASDYWQSQLMLIDFMQLTEMMLLDIRRLYLGLTPLQKDIELSAVLTSHAPTDEALQLLTTHLQQTKLSLQQNVQEKFAYDYLMQKIAQL